MADGGRNRPASHISPAAASLVRMNTDVVAARPRAAAPNPAPGSPQTTCRYRYVYQDWSYQSFNKTGPPAANYCRNPAILRPGAQNGPHVAISGRVTPNYP